MHENAVDMVGQGTVDARALLFGANMKCFTINWLLPSPRSARGFFPSGVSKTYCFCTLTQGNALGTQLIAQPSQILFLRQTDLARNKPFVMRAEAMPGKSRFRKGICHGVLR
jgi:hypothetical protein